MEESAPAPAAPRAKSLARLAADLHVVEPGQEYVIDDFRPEDALPVTRCVYDVYGPDHPFDYVYDPEAVARRFVSGEHYTAVARTPRGDVLGMISLYRCPPWPGTLEAGQLMIMRSCRDASMGLTLCRYADTTLAARANADALYVEAVCTHVFTQYISRKCRFVECGLELEALPAGVFSQGEQGARKRTSMLFYFSVKKDRPHDVFLPPRAAELGELVYRRLKSQRTFTSGLAGMRGHSSGLTSTLLPLSGLARLEVTAAGEDLLARAAMCERELGEGAVQVILNLADPAAPEAAEALRARGYFLGGVLPLWFGTDGLLLQRLSAPPDFETLKIGSADGKDMLRLVRGDMESLGAPALAWGVAP